MPNYGYHAARRRGDAVRRAYSAVARRGRLRRLASPPSLSPEVEVLGFAGHASFPEQVASLRTFLAYVGAPSRFRIVSDGSIDDGESAILQGQHPSVEVVDWREYVGDMPDPVARYTEASPLGKKLAVLVTAARSGPHFYADADVLFFPGAAELAARFEAPRPTFQSDCMDWHGWLAEVPGLEPPTGAWVNSGIT